MSKKGFQVELKNLILGVVIAIILIIFFTQVTDYLKHTLYARETCRASVAAASVSSSILPVDCSMQREDIKFDDVVKGNLVDENAIKRKFADRLYDCWYMYGEGSLKGNPFMKEAAIFSKTNICNLCAKITFDKKIAEKITKVSNFEEFLKSTDITGQKIKYYDFLNKKVSGELDVTVFPLLWYKSSTIGTLQLSDIYTNKDYYVIYVAFLPDAFGYIFTYNNIKYGPGDRAKWYARTMLVSADDFESLNCTKIVN